MTEVEDAERELWLARAEAGEISERDAWAAVARLDATHLGRVKQLLDFAVCTPEEVRHARLRLLRSRWKAGDPEVHYEEERAEYMESIARDHAARVAAAVAAPRELHRLLLDACTTFPLGDGDRDLVREQAAASLREVLLADLRPLQEAGRWGERRVELELKLLELRLLLGDIDAYEAHAFMASLYEHVVGEMEQRTIGVLPTPSDLSAARLRVHRERYILGESREYVRMREAHLRDRREWLDALVASMRRTVRERTTALERLEAEFPPPEARPVLDPDD